MFYIINIDEQFFSTNDLSFKNEEFQEGTKNNIILWSMISNCINNSVFSSILIKNCELVSVMNIKGSQSVIMYTYLQE